ncbi:hypothetical protein [Parafilimonas terrae]|uniref:Uncharacterized protein n=1 Tax=Parafilimonas terrae TaxID=1465490 RepID=A0A1I5TID4_9BACT|nr:hypothetical protein [Parafilimonas terrae]SFP82824.1 hypothetical protein SAMN05444277_102149 [Parafilimonas terrae]
MDGKCRPDDEKNILDNELLIFNTLMENAKPQNTYDFEGNPDILKMYRKAVTNRAKSLIGTPYDLKFDFENFDSFSCIEFVWYCYKCLFPLHRIRVKDFEFLQSFKVPIIIPDVFVKNDFFKYIYSSVRQGGSKILLMEHVKKHRWALGWFLLSVFVWDVILMLLFCCCYHFNN